MGYSPTEWSVAVASSYKSCVRNLYIGRYLE